MTNKIHLVQAKRPYRPDCCDLVCGFYNSDSVKYLKRGSPSPKSQVLPLCLINLNPWMALSSLDVDFRPIYCSYKCPYSLYTFNPLIPSTLISTNLKKKWGPRLANYQKDYLLDHEYHRRSFGDKLFDPNKIGQLMLGSGYTSSTTQEDGDALLVSTLVGLDNGDNLLVHFWEWYNR